MIVKWWVNDRSGSRAAARFDARTRSSHYYPYLLLQNTACAYFFFFAYLEQYRICFTLIFDDEARHRCANNTQTMVSSTPAPRGLRCWMCILRLTNVKWVSVIEDTC